MTTPDLLERTETMAVPAKKDIELAHEFQAPVVDSGDSLMAVISRAARDPGVDVDKFERLTALAERGEARASEREFNVAMNEVQEAIRPIAADASNPQTKSKYASYLALDKALRPIYTKHGFSLSFDTGDAGADMVRVLCYVSHRDGHSRTYKVDMPADGKGAKGGDVMTKTHAIGASLTYSQRYLLKLIFNIAVGEDTDGNNTGGAITPEQLQHVRDVMDRIGNVDVEAFCKVFKIEAVPDLRAKDYDRAMGMLNLKEKKIQK